MLRRPHAAQGTREFVRGSLASLPFSPGVSPGPKGFSCNFPVHPLLSSCDDTLHQCSSAEA